MKGNKAPPSAQKKVLVAVSGGVDSATAALLLKRQGYDVAGVTMALTKDAQSEATVEKAVRVCRQLDIKHVVMDIKKSFDACVIQPFIDAYLDGTTPNPCVLCNQTIKFGAVLTYALENDYDYLATGHYANIVFDGRTGTYELWRGVDKKKDQSYVLYHLSQEKLRHLLFPLGDLTKDIILDMATNEGLVAKNMPESQDICFIEDGDYAAYITKAGYDVCRPGDFVDIKGHIIGRHDGIARYTIGQRKGIGLAADHPYFVVAIHARDNQVVLGQDEDLFKRELIVRDVCFVSGNPCFDKSRVLVKIRYGATPSWAFYYDMIKGKAKLVFDQPQRAITPGQAAVFYDNDRVLGGGTIEVPVDSI